MKGPTMSTHVSELSWDLRAGEDFPHGRYSRAHTITFDGGVTLPASASPHVVGKWADPAAVDPEEMLVAALSSCHMLTFLHQARLAGFIVSAYEDEAEGDLTESAEGRLAVTAVRLRPRISWSGEAPDAATIAQLHHAAHRTCFIANSVTTKVSVEAPLP